MEIDAVHDNENAVGAKVLYQENKVWYNPLINRKGAYRKRERIPLQEQKPVRVSFFWQEILIFIL